MVHHLAGEGIVRGHGVRAQLRDVAVGLVRPALAVAVDEKPGEGGGADRVLAEAVHAVEGVAVAVKTRLRHVVRIVDRHLAHGVRRDGERQRHDFRPPERHHHPELRKFTLHHTISREERVAGSGLVRDALRADAVEHALGRGAADSAFRPYVAASCLHRPLLVQQLAPDDLVGTGLFHVHLKPAELVLAEIQNRMACRVRRDRNGLRVRPAHDLSERDVSAGNARSGANRRNCGQNNKGFLFH